MKTLSENGWRILLVDDDEDDYLLTHSMLKEAQGRRVELEWAPSYQVGLEMLRMNDYQAVLVDYDLGVSSGIQFIREGVQGGYPAPIILFTDRRGYEIDLEAMEAGATLYLTKAEVTPLLLERSLRYAIERKHTEEALRQALSKAEESERRYRTLFETMTEGFALHEIICDEDGVPCDYRFLEVNPAFERLTGLKAGDILGRTLRQILPDIESFWIEHYGRVALSGEPDHIEQYSSALGRWYEVYAFQTEYGRFATIFLDVTNRRRTEEALREANERLQEQTDKLTLVNQKLLAQEDELRLIMDATPALISYLEEDYRYRWVNRVYERWFGLTAGSVQGNYVWEVLGREAFQTVRKYLDQALAGKVVEYEVELPYREGGMRWIRATLAPDRDATGRVRGVVGHVVDIGEIKKAEADLRRSEQRHRELADALEAERAKLAAALDNLPVGVGTGDPSGTILSLNQAGLQLHGFQTQEEMFAELDEYIQHFELRYPDGRIMPLVEWPVSRAQRGEFVRDYEVILRNTRRGLERIVSYSVAPVWNSQGELALIVYVMQDLTEQKRSEQALRQSQMDMDRAQEVGQIGIWRLDVRRNVLTWSKENYRIFGVPEATPMTYETFLEIVHVDDRHYVDTQWEAGLAGEPYDIEHRIVVDGQEKWVREKAYLEFDDNDRVLGGFGITQDITERKQAEAALSAAHERTRRVLHSITEGYYALDAGWRFVEMNPIAEKHFKRIAAELVGKDIWGETGTPQGSLIYEKFHEAMATCQPMRLEAESSVNPGKWSALYLYPHPDGLEVYFHDITERKLAEDALLTYMDELKRSNQALEDFAFIASHDLQEPLRKVKAFGNLLKSGYGQELGKQGQDYIERMQQAAGRMQGMLDGLLAYARITSQSRPFTQVDLNQVVSEVLSDLEIRLTQTGGRVEADPLPTIEADPVQIYQLFQNLIGNALKFHRPDVPPRVRITCNPAGDNRLDLAITDNGIGFEAHQAGYLFQPFHRLHGRFAYEGSGMGLAICRKIVERHAGSITVESRLGEGTAFRLNLPIRS